MDFGGAVRCMRHCSSEYNIFFTTFPAVCPICGQKTNDAFLLVPPFCVPSPFFSKTGAPFSVVLKPTRSCFLTDYRSGDDLHIGVTCSKGFVYHFDQNGVHMADSYWSSFISINIGNIHNLTTNFIKSEWDTKLNSHCCQKDWIEKYDVTTNNCYNFVLSFLKSILPVNVHSVLNKDIFSERYIVPLTIRAGQYIDLKRKVSVSGTVVMPVK